MKASAAVQPVLDQLNEIAGADGGELRLLSATDTMVELELDVSHASCPECVVPKEMLLEIMRHRLAEAAPDVREIRLHDPREPLR